MNGGFPEKFKPSLKEEAKEVGSFRCRVWKSISGEGTACIGIWSRKKHMSSLVRLEQRGCWGFEDSKVRLQKAGRGQMIKGLACPARRLGFILWVMRAVETQKTGNGEAKSTECLGMPSPVQGT